MARVMTAPELAKIRSDIQFSRLFLGFLAPATVFTARVNGDPASDDQLAELTYDGGSAGFANAIVDQLIYVGSGAGLYDKGMLRLRGTLAGVAGTMKVGEISEIDFDDDDYLTVVDEFPLAPKHVRLVSGVAKMDYEISYTDQHEFPDPVLAGCPTFTPTWLTGATVDVEFDWSDSWALDGGGLTYVTVAPGASATSGLATATPTITYNAAGTYRVACTVTRDYGGGDVKTMVGYRYVRVYADPGDMPITQFTLENCSGSWQRGGWSFRVTCYAEATRSSVRDRALVCLFARDWYAHTEGSMGPISDRENIVALGWIDGETIAWDPETGSVSFEVQGPQHWLAQMQGYTSGVEDVQVAPTDWTEFQTLDLRSGLWHFLHWRSTVTRMMDVQVTGDTTGISLFNASPGTLWGQISGEAEATIRAHPCCDRFGRLFVEVEPQLVPTGSRTGPTVQALLAQDLRVPVSIGRRTAGRVGLVDSSGIVYAAGSGSSIFSLAPGHVPQRLGPGTASPTRQALASQAQANTLAGLELDWLNNEYPDVSLPLASNHRMLDVCPQQYVTLTLVAGDTVRGIVWTNQKLLPRSVSFRYNHSSGMLLTDVEAEAETTGVGGIDGDVPPATPPDPGYPSYEAPPVWDPGPAATEWPTTMYVGTQTSGVYYTGSFTAPDDSAQPTWSAINTGLGATDIRQMGIDYFDKADRQFCLLETARDLYRRENEGSWATILTNAAARTALGLGAEGFIMYFAPDRGVDGVLYVLFAVDTGANQGIYYLKTTDYTAGTPGWAGGLVRAHNLSYNNVGNIIAVDANVYLAYSDNGAPGKRTYVESSHDGGGSWTKSPNLGISAWPPFVHCDPFNAGFAWANGNGVGGPDLVKVQDAAALVVFQDAYNIGPLRPDTMWFSDVTSGLQRILKALQVWETTDQWVSLVDSTPTALTPSTLVSLCELVSADDDHIIFGADPDSPVFTYPHHILAMEGSDGTTATGKAGTNAGTAPYTDAIPETAGGICWEGIQVVE
jgi:PKD repeat protein